MSEKFKFEGFEPTDEIRAYAKEVLWYVQDKSPWQSARQAMLRKTEKGYLGLMKISSMVGVFSTEFTADDPKQAIEGLYEKIGEILSTWSRQRHSFGDAL